MYPNTKIKILGQIITLTSVIALQSCRPNATEQESGILQRETVEIAYDKCGSGDTTLLFIHGWCINKGYWSEQMKKFCGRYTTVAVDLPGFGASGKNREKYDFAEYARDVDFVIKELNLKNVIAIGHSMSGDIILQLGSNYPTDIAGIVGIDNLHEPGDVPTPEEQQQTDDFFSMMESHFDSTISIYMVRGLFQPSTDTAIVRRVLADVRNSDSVIAINVLRALSEASQNEKSWMKSLHSKLFLVNSDVNKVDSSALAKYCAKGFHVEYVHGTGHYPMLEAPAEFDSALQRTLDLIGEK